MLYDLEKGFPAEVPEAAAAWRFILVHRDSWRWASLATKKAAMRILVATAKGEDVHGILPATLPPGDQPLGGLEKPPAPGQDEGKASSVGGQADSTRARVESDIPPALAFQRALAAEFPDEYLAMRYKQLAEAKKHFVDKEGNVVTVDDDATSLKALDGVREFLKGKALPKEKVKEEARFTKRELDRNIDTSPAMRRYLLERIVRAGDAAEIKQPAAPALVE